MVDQVVWVCGKCGTRIGESEIRGTDATTSPLATMMDQYQSIELKISWQLANFTGLQGMPADVLWLALRVLARDVTEHERLGIAIRKAGFPLPI